MAARVELVISDGKRVGEPPGGPPDGGGPLGDLPAGPVFASEVYCASELQKRLAGDWRCALGHWYGWDGARWKKDELRRVWNIARKTCSEIAAFIDTTDLARKIERNSTIHAAVRIAEAYEDIAISVAHFDCDIWVLNTPDGIVDLRSGQLLPHDRAALITKLANAGPMPRESEGEAGHNEFAKWLETVPASKVRAYSEKLGAAAPVFARFLHESTGGDLALMQYLQRVAGYCLNGSTKEEIIIFLHGPGGTGKSTFLWILQQLLGDYAVTAPVGMFMATDAVRHATELARMAGARLVTASEIDENARWDEAKLKMLSGSDAIAANYMRQDIFEFIPQFTLVIAGNHRPRMRSADSAMLRRLRMVPFSHKPDKVDPDLRIKLEAELGAILRWAIEGGAAWQRERGLKPPPAVVKATAAYFRDENTIGKWIDERCEADRNAFCETRMLYRDFVVWVERVGEFRLSERAFGQKLEQMAGVERGEHSKTRRHGFRGLKPLYATGDLLDYAEARRTGDDRQGELGVEANLTPGAAPDDPGDEWER